MEAFFGQFALGMLQSTFALFGEAVIFQGYSQQATKLGVGLLFSVVGVSQVITQTFILRRMVKRYSTAGLVMIGSVLRMIGMFLFAVAVSPWLAVIPLILFPLGLGITMPALQSLGTETVTDEVRGGVLGLYQSTVSLATIFSTALGGVLFAVTPATPYWVGGVLSAVIIIPTLYLWQQHSRPKDIEGGMTPSKI